jgi:hypothetical protein
MTIALPPEVENWLYSSVVDQGLRSTILDEPARFGVDAGALPEAVEPHDPAGLDLSDPAMETFLRASTCSWGPVTVVCDKIGA